MDVNASFASKSRDTDIIGLQQIFFNKNTNFTMYKIVYKQLISFFSQDNNSMEIITLITNLYNERISEERFNMELKYLISIWVVICIIGMVSNIFVITVLSRVRQKIVYEIFCIGLAVTDLSILVFAVPITTLHYGMEIWIFEDITCKMVNFLVYVAVFSSTMMLLILTITRFMGVVFPWENRSFSTKRARFACYIIWILGGVFSAPVLIYFEVSNETNHMDMSNSSNKHGNDISNQQKCHINFPNDLSRTVYFVTVFVLTYILPFKSMIIMNAMIVRRLKSEFGQRKQMDSANDNCKTKVSSSFIDKSKVSVRENEKRQRCSRVTKIVILVTMLYCICWLPTQIMNVWYYIDPERFPTNRGMRFIKFISQTLSFASACINPIVYSIMSDTFKKSRERICRCCFSKTKKSVISEFENNKDIAVQLSVVYKNKKSYETVMEPL